ncbi:MAG: hypothetical protein ABR574_12750 [Cryomorphaceae bacterium]
MTRYEIGIYEPVLIVAMLLVYSCQTTKSISSQEKCKQDVKNFIADKWSYNPETKLYREGRGMIEFTSTKFQLKECIVGMEKKTLKEIFGTPSVESDRRLYYYYYEHCFENFQKFCLGYMMIKLDEEQKYESMGFGSITTEG